MSYHRRAISTKGLSLFTRSSQNDPVYLAAEALTVKGMREPFSRDDIKEILTLLHSLPNLHHNGYSVQFSPSLSTFYCNTERPPSFPPHPYGVKGGGARGLLLELMGICTPSPRDIDVIRKGSHPHTLDDSIAAQFMPDDFRFGGKIELVTEVERYLSNRDLTINEVMYLDGTLSFSPFALLDSITRTLRPSRYRSGTLSKPPQLAGRVFLKMIRLRAEFLSLNENWQIVGIPSDLEFTETDLAIQLEKALQRGGQIAENFLKNLVEGEFITMEDAPYLPKIIEELHHLTIGESAIIRSLPIVNSSKN